MNQSSGSQGADPYEAALRVALNLLSVHRNVEPALIRSTVDQVLQLMPEVSESRERLERELWNRHNIWISTGSVLEDRNSEHVPWLPSRRGEIPWLFWHRYESMLLEEKGWAPATIRRLSELTDDVLARLEDPSRPGAWDRRGLVVGQVQSGKTSNYTGLISKAADAGYKLIVILAGSTNSLRSQTQLRLDEGFLGFDTRANRAFDQDRNRWIGVGLGGGAPLRASSGTNSEDNGDFNRNVMNQFGIMLGGDPVLLVVKKYQSVLRNLIRWATGFARFTDPETGSRIAQDVPLLLIDDEADYASINTRAVNSSDPDDDDDPTKINGRIRELLRAFEQSAYVGYTATPFANIFIHPDATTETHGDDIFPRDFIISLPVPSNYIGPARVFGIDDDPRLGIEGRDALPIVHPIDDFREWVPDTHRKTLEVGELPESLRLAILDFVLVAATRTARGQTREHNSMLVHVTRFVDVQRQISEQIREELHAITNRLRYATASGPNNIRDELRSRWESSFEPVTHEICEIDPEIRTETVHVTWPEVDAELGRVAAAIQVMDINGTAKDALAYWDYPDGLSVIAVGGDKLSRGLTLEGLSVSYYLRASRMYDTLMQMGRWFGYRPGYADLCRLYTTAELIEWYRHITIASEEVKREFDFMVDTGRTPRDFGLKVLSHPAGLTITSASKMRSGTPMKLSYSGDISESIVFYRSPQIVDANFRVIEEFLYSLDESPEIRYEEAGRRGQPLWKEVPGEQVSDLLDELVSHPSSRKANSALLARYIRAQLPRKELAEWTVVLISNQQTTDVVTIAGRSVGRSERAPVEATSDRYAIKRLLNPPDERLDLSATEVQQALEATQEAWRKDPGRYRGNTAPTQPGGPYVRRTRRTNNGLLLLYPLKERIEATGNPVIGFALSFPKSETAEQIDYVVNNPYWEQEFGDSD